MSGSIPPRVAPSDPWPTLPLRSLPRGAAREACALAASAAVGSAVWLSAPQEPLPVAAGTAAFLAAAAWWDVRALRIPNALTLPTLGAALVWSGLAGGWGGLGAAGLAAGAALALLLGPFAWGWLGAGDVKALLVLAALWGLAPFLAALWWMLVIGGTGALAVLAARGELADLLRRWGRSLWLSLVTRRPYYVSAAPGSAARTGLPFALAMGLGSAAHALFGAPW